MAEAKTKPTTASVAAFLKRIPDDERRKDCLTVVRLMKQVTRAKPTMWGTAIVGFGRYHYTYASGHEGETCLAAFASRKQGLTLYITGGLRRHEALLAKLGKHKSRGGCLYIQRLEDVNLPVLKRLIVASVRHAKKAHA